jgi:ribonuclease HII
VAAAGMPAVAVTDQHNLFAMMKFYREALRAGIKPLVGVDLLVREEGERQAPSRLTLLCQSQGGYRNLARLITRAYLEGQERGVPRIERRWLSRAALEGLIALSGASDGDVGRALVNARERDAERALDGWLTLFPGRFYLELQRLGRPFEEAYIAGAVALAARRGVPVVASNDVRFLTPAEFESHEARVCIHDGALLADAGRTRRYTHQQYLRSPQEMAALFADVPEALANSVEIARRCSLALTLGEVRLPQYPVPAGASTEEFLREESARGLAARFAAAGDVPPGHAERARLAPIIMSRALAWGVGRADRDEIDTLNILEATLLAMRRALLALPVPPTHVRVDGNRCPCLADLAFGCTVEAIIAGDARIAAISAASILAKTYRDALMEALDAHYPGFALATHKGYATAAHLEALKGRAPSAQHRRSFSPMRATGEAPLSSWEDE